MKARLKTQIALATLSLINGFGSFGKSPQASNALQKAPHAPASKISKLTPDPITWSAVGHLRPRSLELHIYVITRGPGLLVQDLTSLKTLPLSPPLGANFLVEASERSIHAPEAAVAGGLCRRPQLSESFYEDAIRNRVLP